MPVDHHAKIDWDAQGQPLSREYADVYFSRHSGLGETRHVFLDGNDLHRRFAELPAAGSLTIGETGFGTGLNFLCAWQLFQQHAPAGARLQFVSVEKHPLRQCDLQRALALWPELAGLSVQLVDQYLAVHPGYQRLLFEGGRVVLTLLVGDVLECLPELDAEIDAWFLDGFSPSRNPQMWRPELFVQLARLSSTTASLATFTSAGFVRRGLLAVGFDVRRIKGFGAKREMLSGHFRGQPTGQTKPWFSRPARPSGPRTALVIGGGLAGCATAASLAARGWQVSLLERHGQLAAEASGNPQGVLYLKLSAHGTALSQLILSGFGYTRRLLTGLPAGADWQACGVLQLAFNAAEQARQEQLAAAFPNDLLRRLDAAQATALAGVDLNCGGLLFPQAGWVHPPALCRLLAGHPHIRVLPHHEALDLRRHEHGWQAWANGRLLASASVVVLAGAADACRFPLTRQLPLRRIRGQITHLPATVASQALCCVLCAEGYVAPARNGQHTLGASFDFKRDDLWLCPDQQRGNLQLLRAISGDLAQRLLGEPVDGDSLDGRVAFRCTTPDYLPLIGPLAEHSTFLQRYAGLSKNAHRVPDAPCPWLDGVYLNTGHGSRGLISAPLAGELLAAWLDNEPLPVPRSVAEACHPNRFALRQLVRRAH